MIRAVLALHDLIDSGIDQKKDEKKDEKEETKEVNKEEDKKANGVVEEKKDSK